MDIWIDLQRAAREHNGKTVETTLLGKVLPIRRPSGLTGYIPDCLQKTAANYGLVIEAALWKEGSYVLRAAAPN